MAGVLHELVLLVLARLQRGEHRAERATELAGLVATVDGDRDVETAGLCDLAGNGRQPQQAARDLSRDQQAQQR